MAGIEEAFEKFSDRLAREESKRYARDEQGDYVEEVVKPYPIKLGPLELGANANMSTGKFSPNEYDNISTHYKQKISEYELFLTKHGSKAFNSGSLDELYKEQDLLQI